jgi:hypothetical protein
MLQRIHHHGRADSSHFAVCCGDLTSIKILNPKNGTVFYLPESSVEVNAVVLNPLENSQVFAQVEDNSGQLISRMLLSILPGSARIIQSGRVLGRDEPDNIAHLWTASFSIKILGKFVITASASIFLLFFDASLLI